MIIINTISELYFELDGIQHAKIYQPLAQGAGIGIYSIFDTRFQLISSSGFDQFEIDGVTYGSQAEVIEVLLDVVYNFSGTIYLSDYNVSRIDDNGNANFYIAESDSNISRGDALKLAISEASANDKIYVRAGTYDCNNLLVNDIYYYFEDGAIIDYTGVLIGDIFSDNGSAFTINIDGNGIFINQGNYDVNQTVFNFTGATGGSIKFKEGFAPKFGIISHVGTTIKMYCDKISATAFIFDGTGNPIFYLYANEIITDGEGFDFDGTSDTAEFYIFADKIITNFNDDIFLNTGNYKFQVNNAFIETVGTGRITSDSNSDNEFINCVFKSNNAYEFEGSVKLYNSRNFDGTVPASQSGTITYLGYGIAKLSLEIYADNAAAIVGGLEVNDVYKTATGELRIVV